MTNIYVGNLSFSTTEDELRAYCRERLAPYKVPAHVEFRTELPKSMIGKVLRRMLAAEAREPGPRAN